MQVSKYEIRSSGHITNFFLSLLIHDFDLSLSMTVVGFKHQYFLVSITFFLCFEFQNNFFPIANLFLTIIIIIFLTQRNLVCNSNPNSQVQG